MAFTLQRSYGRILGEWFFNKFLSSYWFSASVSTTLTVAFLSFLFKSTLILLPFFSPLPLCARCTKWQMVSLYFCSLSAWHCLMACIDRRRRRRRTAPAKMLSQERARALSCLLHSVWPDGNTLWSISTIWHNKNMPISITKVDSKICQILAQ